MPITGEVPTSIQDDQTVFTHLEVDKRGYRIVVGEHESEFTDELILTDTPTIKWNTSKPGKAEASVDIPALNIPVDTGITELTGDVTAGPGDGSQVATIANDAVTTAKIINDAVTYAKIQNVTSGRLLGRSTIGAGDTEEITIGSGLLLSGGALSNNAPDPWTVVKLGSNFTTTSAANTNVTGFNFTPAANKTYAIFGILLIQTTNVATGARPGIAWPSAGVTTNCAWINASDGSASNTQRFWDGTTTQNAATPSEPTVNVDTYAKVEALLVMTAGATGTFQITLASETALTQVQMSAGSFFMYREI